MTALTQIIAVAIAPDASWAVTVSADGTVRTRDTGVPPRPIRWTVPIDGSQLVAVALAGDRVRVLWADGATIRLRENVESAWPREAEFPAPVRAPALSPSGVLAVAACADGTLRILNTGTGEFAPPVTADGKTALAVAVASEGVRPAGGSVTPGPAVVGAAHGRIASRPGERGTAGTGREPDGQ